ncbi:hypothetical protein AURDEDRAFT_177871 [Auricularia subglabra TFB-10046 SS5]|uniref:Uncharacterized protein n=1 Tax=Auricularia subglabra (strain TFB-10046 / SS5) TaxID=717982 RepID=J0D308_AURST|nr:hypothetical protein AURDEDRAFT_177871 [Auricularia subglabra TFB-10046 SS5]
MLWNDAAAPRVGQADRCTDDAAGQSGYDGRVWPHSTAPAAGDIKGALGGSQPSRQSLSEPHAVLLPFLRLAAASSIAAADNIAHFFRCLTARRPGLLPPLPVPDTQLRPYHRHPVLVIAHNVERGLSHVPSVATVEQNMPGLE